MHVLNHTVRQHWAQALRSVLDAFQRVHTYNHTNMLLLLVVIASGLLMLASASVYESMKYFGWPYMYFLRQLGAVVLAGALFVMVYMIPLQFWYRVRLVLLAIALLIVLLPLVQQKDVNSTYRWVDFFGLLRLQSVEISRPLFLAFFAASCYSIATNQVQRYHKLFGALVMLTLYVGCLWLQKSYTMSVIVLSVSLLLLFLAGLKFKEFVVLMLVCVPLAIFVALSEEYRARRITAFFSPDSYVHSYAYQQIQAEKAISSGGFFGNGLGTSSYKLGGLPEPHNDFIIAIMVEEVGLFGVLLFLSVFFALIVRLCYAAGRYARRNIFAGFFSLSLLLVLLANALINIGVTFGFLPVTGLPFPLLSYGGSFMLYTFFTLAIAFRVEYENQHPVPAR